jgi:hypothetical protein
MIVVGTVYIQRRTVLIRCNGESGILSVVGNKVIMEKGDDRFLYDEGGMMASRYDAGWIRVLSREGAGEAHAN